MRGSLLSGVNVIKASFVARFDEGGCRLGGTEVALADDLQLPGFIKCFR